MAGPSLTSQAKQITEIMARFVRVKSFLPTPLPGDLAQLKEQMVEPSFQCCPGSTAEYGVFYRLGLTLSEMEKPLTMSEIGESLGIPLSTATRLVDWMVKGGYVQRLTDQQDRRIIRIDLTESGRAVYQTMNEFVVARIRQILKHLTAEERKSFVKLLNKVVIVMETMGKEAPGAGM